MTTPEAIQNAYEQLISNPPINQGPEFTRDKETFYAMSDKANLSCPSVKIQCINYGQELLSKNQCTIELLSEALAAATKNQEATKTFLENLKLNEPVEDDTVQIDNPPPIEPDQNYKAHSSRELKQ